MRPSLSGIVQCALLLAGTSPTAQCQDAPSAFSRHRPSTIYAVRGRCIGAETGEPLAGCSVRLSGHQSTGYALSWSCLDWRDPEPISTSVDGSFRFDLQLPPSVYPPVHGWPDRIHVELRHPQRAGWFVSCTLPVLVDRGGLDLGDLKLIVGSRPFLNVVDTDGRVEPGAIVKLQLDVQSPVHSTFGLDLFPAAYQSARVRSDGRVHLESVLQPGKWRVTVENRQLVEGGAIVVPSPPERPPRSQIVLAPLNASDRIAGRVVDASGSGVAELYVGLEDLRGLGALLREPNTSQRTAEDGSFAFVRDVRSPANTLLLLGNNRCDPWVRDATVEWGDDKVRVVLPAATELRLDVADDDGKPVEDLLVHCVPDVAGGLGLVREGRRFAGGRVAIGGVLPGAYRLLVWPRDVHLGPSPWTAIGLTASSAPVRVVLPVLARRTVRVLLANGGAARDVRVDLVRPNPGRVVLQPWPLAYVLGEEGPRRTSPKHDLLLARGWTDQAGCVALHAEPKAEPLELRIHGPCVQSTTHTLVGWATGDEQLTFVVEEGVTLSGAVKPASALEGLMPRDTERRQAVAFGSAGMLPELASRRPGLIVRPAGSGQDWRDLTFPLMPDGSYRIEGLPPGKCLVSFVHWRDPKRRSEPVDVGEVELRLGEPLRRDFDLPAVTSDK